jgi:hypothetical protein
MGRPSTTAERPSAERYYNLKPYGITARKHPFKISSLQLQTKLFSTSKYATQEAPYCTVPNQRTFYSARSSSQPTRTHARTHTHTHAHSHTQFGLANISFLASVLLPPYEAALNFNICHDNCNKQTTHKQQHTNTNTQTPTHKQHSITFCKPQLQFAVFKDVPPRAEAGCATVPEESIAVISRVSCRGAAAVLCQTARPHWPQQNNVFFTALWTLNLVKMELFRK